MKISTSSLMLASLAFTGSALAAPTPRTPYDSPVNSPRPDEFSETVHSPRIPRSPMVPAVRVAGRRRSLPRAKRQEGETASASGLLSGVGDALSGLLNQVGDVAHSLPVAGGLGILSADGSNPPMKRDTPEGDTASASGLLSGVGDALSGLLGQAGDIAHSLPVLGDIGILSNDGSHPPMKRDAPEGDTASASGLLSGVGDALSGLLGQAGDIAHSLPIVGDIGILSADGSNPSMKRDAPPAPSPAPSSTFSAPDADALRQVLLRALIQQQQADQAAAALSAASSGLPVDPLALQQRLERVANAAAKGDFPTSATTLNALDLSGLVGGLPIAGNLLSGNTLSGLTGLASGPLSTVGSVAGGLPIVGGLLGGLPSTAGGLLNGVASTADGLVGGVLGQASTISQQNVIPDVLGGRKAFSGQLQPSAWTEPEGVYHHTLGGAPIVPQNSLVDGSLPMLNVDGSSLPLVPPPSPASSAASVPMGHSASGMDFPSAASFFISSEGVEDASPSSSTPLPSSTNVARAIKRDAVGEDPSHSLPDDSADGFTPAIPDAAYHPPLLASSKRADVHGVREADMHEGGVDAVPGPLDALSGTKTAPRFNRMIRRMRGLSVAF